MWLHHGALVARPLANCTAALLGEAPDPTHPHAIEHRTSRRRPLGVRLWLADLAARVRLSGAGAGAADRGAPCTLCIQSRAPWYAGAPRARAWARLRRRLPRRCLPCGGEEPRRG